MVIQYPKDFPHQPSLKTANPDNNNDEKPFFTYQKYRPPIFVHPNSTHVEIELFSYNIKIEVNYEKWVNVHDDDGKEDNVIYYRAEILCNDDDCNDRCMVEDMGFSFFQDSESNSGDYCDPFLLSYGHRFLMPPSLYGTVYNSTMRVCDCIVDWFIDDRMLWLVNNKTVKCEYKKNPRRRIIDDGEIRSD